LILIVHEGLELDVIDRVGFLRGPHHGRRRSLFGERRDLVSLAIH
jgi:hypothetical protein